MLILRGGGQIEPIFGSETSKSVKIAIRDLENDLFLPLLEWFSGSCRYSSAQTLRITENPHFTDFGCISQLQALEILI